jgi:threonine/homoserine/homoserine lactone efflux protein
MTFFLSFLSGFIASVIGIFPPGLINMTAAKTSIDDGRNRAMLFVLGALIVIFFQTYISIIFAQYINNNVEVIVLLREIGLFIFTALTVYFLGFAKKPTTEKQKKTLRIKSKKSRFFIGMLISAVNFFPIPYYVFVSITLASYNIFSFDTTSVFSFVSGTVVGSFAVFYCYVVFFDKMKSKTDYFVKNMNTIIGSITAIVALITLVNILKYYFNGS